VTTARRHRDRTTATENAWRELLPLREPGWNLRLAAGCDGRVVAEHAAGRQVFARDAVQLVEHLRMSGVLPRLNGGRTR
jgi:hypothetical protein